MAMLEVKNLEVYYGVICALKGISFEVNRLIGRFDNWFTKIMRAPGVWFQGFTTFEPDDSMIEVAIAALKAVIPEEEGADKW